jgi:competence protein ComEA
MLTSALVLTLTAAASGQQGPAQSGSTTKPTAPKPASSTPEAPAPPINLNLATAEDLQKLPGVGPAVAARIIEQRQKLGGFKKIEDLMTVRGIGEKTFLKLKPLVIVTPPKAAER